MTGVAPAIFAIMIYLSLLPEIEFAPTHFVIRVASGFDVLGVLRNFFAAFFAVLDIATVDDRLHPGLELFVFLKPALNLLRRRFHETSYFLN
jgi:hypothetical protein